MSDLDIINQLEHLITVADQMKSSYFWHAPARYTPVEGGYQS